MEHIAIPCLNQRGNIMKLTIGKKIALGFAAAFLVTGSLGWFTANRLNYIQLQSRVIIENAIPGVQASAHIRFKSQELFGRSLEHALKVQDKDQQLELENEMKADKQSIEQILAACQEHIKSQIDAETIEEVRSDFKTWVDNAQAMISLSHQDKPQEAMALFYEKVDPSFDKLMEATQKLEDFNIQDADADSARISNSIAASRNAILITSTVGGVGMALLMLGIVRGLNRAIQRIAGTLEEGSTQVAAASREVAESSQVLAQGASDQAASLEETSSSLEEMSSMTRKNAETAHQASLLSAEAKTAADKGNQAMTRMSGAINDIERSAIETARIVKTIDEIAFQTNLLALNAAVEAARAGETGKGFAVVAEEVRNLAMRSAAAAKSTANMIDSSVASAKNGVLMAQEVGATLTEIQRAAQKANALIGEIASASHEQSMGIDQVNTAVQQMDRVTQSNAAGAEESAASSQELNSQAEQLKCVVTEMLGLIGGQTTDASDHARRSPTATTAHHEQRSQRISSARSGALVGRRPSKAMPLDDQESFRDFDAAA
jgi:methyl-accepting chemotaxis protein